MLYVKRLRNSAKRLGVAQKKKSVGRKYAGKARDYFAHHPGGQVHNYVAAKNYVETMRLPELIVLVSDIAFVESHHRLHALVQYKPPAFAAEVFLDAVRRRRAHRPRRIAAAPRLGQRFRVNIDAEDRDSCGSQRAKLPQLHRERVGLFAAGTSGGQNPDRPDGIASAQPRQGYLGKYAELLGTAEEVALADSKLRGELAQLIVYR